MKPLPLYVAYCTISFAVVFAGLSLIVSGARNLLHTDPQAQLSLALSGTLPDGPSGSHLFNVTLTDGKTLAVYYNPNINPMVAAYATGDAITLKSTDTGTIAHEVLHICVKHIAGNYHSDGYSNEQLAYCVGDATREITKKLTN